MEVPRVPHRVDASDGELQTHGTQGTRDQFGPSAAIITRSKVFSLIPKHTRAQTKKAGCWIIGDWKIYIWMESLALPPTNSPLLVTAHVMSTSFLRLPFNVVHIHNVTSFISLNAHYIKEEASLCFSLLCTLGS